MFKASEFIFSWWLSQKVMLYLDNNENWIFDKQDTIKYQSVWNLLNNTELNKITNELTKTNTWHTLKFETVYYKWNKEIDLINYNQNLFLYNSVDIIVYILIVFVLWFILFPKKK